jgi:hypothetical protein
MGGCCQLRLMALTIGTYSEVGAKLHERCGVTFGWCRGHVEKDLKMRHGPHAKHAEGDANQ